MNGIADVLIEAVEDLLKRSEISREDMAKRMYITVAEFEAVLSGQKRIKRLHTAGLERAMLSLALEKRDPSYVSPQFQWQMLRYAMLVLQAQKPADTEAAEKDMALV